MVYNVICYCFIYLWVCYDVFFDNILGEYDMNVNGYRCLRCYKEVLVLDNYFFKRF